MRRHHVPVLAFSSFIVAAAAWPAAAQAPNQRPPAGAQQQQQQQPAQRPPAGAQQQQQQPPVAPPKAYKAVAVKLAAPSNDASFNAFRKQVADIAKRKDRPALAKLVVAQGFFWDAGNGDKADKKKSGIDNLAGAIGLDAKEGFGWDMLVAASQEQTIEAQPDRKGVMCAPAGPEFDTKGFEEIVKATGTDESDWAFVVASNIDMRSAARANAPVTEKLGQILVRVMPEDAPPPAAGNAQDNAPPFIRVVGPSGKVGYVPEDAVAPLAFDQLCYVKDAAGWKITGLFGGEQ